MDETEVAVEVNNKKMTYRNSSILVKISFIVGLSAILAGSGLVVIDYAIQPNSWIILAFYIFFIILSLVGTITGGIAFKEGKNIFSILGFIFSIVTLLFFIYVTIFIIEFIAQL